MSNALSQFSFQQKAVRTAIINDEINFCLADVCDCLELQNPTHTANQIKEEFETPTLNVGVIESSNNRKLEAIFITEPQLYFVMMRSRSAIARTFRKWICEEVLPAIRKTGTYTVQNQTITKAQQGELATLIAERFPEGNSRPYAWSRFNNHFRLASYKDLPAAKFNEACEYIRDMPVQKKPEDLIREIIGHRRFMLRFDHNGYLGVSLVEPDAFIGNVQKLTKYINDPECFETDDNIRDLADACLNRLYRKIKTGKETVKRLNQKIKEAAK